MTTGRILKPRKTIFNANGQTTANFTAATTDIITSATHGLSDNDVVVLTTTDTLPAGLSTSTRYYVTSATTNTFKLTTSINGDVVDITDTGTGTHTWTEAASGEVINVASYRHVGISAATASSGNMTFKCVGSRMATAPNFEAAQSVTNHYTFIEMIDNDNGDSIAGSTGEADAAGSDIYRDYAVNVDLFNWITLKITAQSAGTLTAWASCTDNN